MINHTFINDALSIPREQKVSVVAKAIRQQAYPDTYVGSRLTPQRLYLSRHTLVRKLEKMKYHRKVAEVLADWVRENVQHAYERGVFVVTDRVLSDYRPFSADTPEALIQALREAEDAHFTAELWYPKNTYTDALLYEKWADEIAQEVGPLTLRYVRAAFTQGMKDAACALIKRAECSHP